jgi:hypothetical protein
MTIFYVRIALFVKKLTLLTPISFILVLVYLSITTEKPTLLPTITEISYRIIIMSPINAAAAVFGHLQHHGDANDLHHSRAPYEENAHSKEEEEVEPNDGDRSATIILLKKFAKFVGNLIHEIGLDEVFFVQPIADITVTARILKDMLTSFMPKSKLQVPDIVEDISLDSSIYTISECQGASHLALLSSEMLLEDDNERLDYSISQLDVLRMSCAASRHLKVDSIDQLPTTIYHEHEEEQNNNELICSSHEDECEEELPGDEQKMTGILNNVLAHQQRSLRQDDHPEFSWMIVPEDPLQDDLTRISQNSSQLQPKEVVVPESISICSSHQSDRKDVDHCVICQGKFKEGENLRVLPCEHMFHCGCIDKLLHNGEGNEVGCPMCKKELEEPQGESYHSDGSVPSWSFKKLGSLLASMSK